MRRVGDAEPPREARAPRAPRAGTVDARVAWFAARRYGVFTRAEAARAGASKDMIRRRVQAGRWVQHARDVFSVAGVPPSWHGELAAAVLAWGPGATISHRAACRLYEVPPFEATPIIELSVPRGRRRRAPGLVHETTLAPRDRALAEGLPITTPARTLIDVAAVASVDALEEALDEALRRHLVSRARLKRRLDELAGSGRSGAGTLRALLEARDPARAVPQSVLETRFLRLLRRARVPPPLTQYPVRSGGRVIAVADFAYRAERLAIETDGYEWHSGRARWQRDRARRNALTLLGWKVIHVTWSDLATEPERVVDQVRAALAAAR